METESDIRFHFSISVVMKKERETHRASSMDGKIAVGSERSTNYIFIHSWEKDYISYGIRWIDISLSTYSFRHEITYFEVCPR